MKIELLPTSKLRVNPDNPRVIRDERFAKLVQSIREFPKMLEIRPIVVNAEMMVLGGNMRLRACQEAGLKKVPVIRADELTEDEQRRFIIADNVAFGEHDWDTLANWDAEELTEWGLEIPDFSTKKEVVEDDYEVPDVIETYIVLGDLFEIGRHRLLCGDSTVAENVERLMDGKMASVCIADPPYGVNMDKGFEGFEGFGGFGTPIARRRYKDDWDSKIPDKAAFDLMFLHSKLTMIFGGNFFAHTLPQSTHWVFWDKCQSMPTFGDGELVWTNSKRKSVSKITVQYNGLIGKEKERFHPTQKPVKVYAELMEGYSETADLLLDPFLGSGTTMVAAHQLDRTCFGMEIDPKYCQVIIDRMLNLDPTLEIKRNGQPYETATKQQEHGI